MLRVSARYLLAQENRIISSHCHRNKPDCSLNDTQIIEYFKICALMAIKTTTQPPLDREAIRENRNRHICIELQLEGQL